MTSEKSAAWDLSRRTDGAIRRRRKWLTEGDVPRPSDFGLLFLGTGGNPTNVVGQWRRTGGFVVTVPGTRIFVDPGPGAVYHAARAHMDLRSLTGVFISHAHTDHAAGAPPVIEAMCRGMTRRHGVLLAPREVLSGMPAFYLGEDPSRWYPGGPERAQALEVGDTASLGVGVAITATPAHHAGPNIGFLLESPGGARIGYTSDTAFVKAYATDEGTFEVEPGHPLPPDIREIVAVEEDLVRAMTGVDLLVMNVSFFNQNPHRHLTALGAAELCRRARPRRAVLTHFDPSLGMPRRRAERAAEFVQATSGVPVLAARDGLRLDLGDIAGP